MGIFSAVLLIGLGLLAASEFFSRFTDKSEEIIGKLRKFQGYAGVIALFWGAWLIIGIILNFGAILGSAKLIILYFGNAAVMTCLGLLMGLNQLKTIVKKEEVLDKLEQLSQKVSPYRQVVGLTATTLGIVNIVL